MITPDLLAIVLARAWRRKSPWHGEEHWRCVAATGMALSAVTPGADAHVAVLFGLLHDTRRENEHVDPEHGARAAAFTHELVQEGALALPNGMLERLTSAITSHSDGLVSTDPVVAVCWDADRLHLPRVGITPDPARFSTEPARSIGWAIRAGRDRERPPSWDDLLDSLSTS